MALSLDLRTVETMIRLTRLRNADPLWLNPDHIERLEHHHETVVKLLNGNEYVVVESPDEIVHQLTLLRASAIALAARMAVDGVDIASGVSAAAASKPLPEVVSGSAPDVDAALAIDHPAQEEKS
jgi:uncharacterized protein YlzI (FlbEa/FlbD family)